MQCGHALEHAAKSAREDRSIIAAQRATEEAKGESGRDDRFLWALWYQERALLHEPLITYLARSGFLPRFGFPIDIAKLDTRWDVPARTDRRQDEKPARSEDAPELRMERSLELALADYVPGSEVIAGKRVYRVDGIVRNWLAEDQDAVRRRYYVECVRCGHFEDRDAPPRECSVCKHPTVQQDEFISEANSAAAQRRSRRRRNETEPDVSEVDGVGPSPVRQYLRPSGFAVKLGRKPRAVVGEIDRLPSPRATLSASDAAGIPEVLAGRISAGFTADSQLFVRSEGRPATSRRLGFGYAICMTCGFSVPEDAFGGAVPQTYARHDTLRGRKRCLGAERVWRNAILGTSLRVDAFRVRLHGDFAPSVPESEQEAFFVSLASCLQLASARRLQIEPRSLKAGIGTYPIDGGVGGLGYRREAVVYEESGSGLLRHLADHPLELIREVVQMLKRGDEAQFIRFDTQFLKADGRLRIDLLKQHFLDPGRCAQLSEVSPLDDLGAVPLRGRGLVLAGVELAEDLGASVSMEHKQLQPELFEAGGIMRAIQRRALAKGTTAPRVLISRMPNLDAGDEEELVVASGIRRMIEDGVEMRTVAATDTTAHAASPWSVLARRVDEFMAVGEHLLGDGSATSARVPVEAKPAAAAKAWTEFEARWNRGRPLTVGELALPDRSAVQFVDVPHGAAEPGVTHAWRLLQGVLGELGALGEVTRIAYLDRYFPRSPVAIWMLQQLLDRLKYGPGAVGLVACYEATGSGFTPPDVRSAAGILKRKSPWDQLTPDQSKSMRDWCRAESGKKGLSLDFDIFERGGLEHPRKLLVEFATGGKLKTLKVLFDKGLDWVKQAAPHAPWTNGRFRANETHVVVVRDPPIHKELDALFR